MVSVSLIMIVVVGIVVVAVVVLAIVLATRKGGHAVPYAAADDDED